MKRSTAVELVRGVVVEGAVSGAAFRSTAERIVAALENNQPWDPEESELPKRLNLLYGSAVEEIPSASSRVVAAPREEEGHTDRNALILAAMVDAYNRLQAGELVEKSLLDETWADNSKRIEENRRLRAELDETTSALQRLAREAGVPDEGPDEIVDAVVNVLREIADLRVALSLVSGRCNTMVDHLGKIRVADEGEP